MMKKIDVYRIDGCGVDKTYWHSIGHSYINWKRHNQGIAIRILKNMLKKNNYLPLKKYAIKEIINGDYTISAVNRFGQDVEFLVRFYNY